MIHHDDPIGRHLGARAQDIHLPRTDVATIAERAAARTARRRKVTFGVTAALLLAGGTFAVVTADGGDDRTPVATGPEAVVGSPLEWTVVDPANGLGGTAVTDPVVTDDGSLYSLSTQPGPAAFAVQEASRTLYRSTDGAEWEPLAMPDDLYATGLAADGNRLYAVGTGPAAGDEIPLRFASSDDGGGTWHDPVDLPALPGLADLGPEVHVSRPTVATHDGTTLVAVEVSAAIDVEGRLPAGIDGSNGYEMGPRGVAVLGAPPTCAMGADAAAGPAGRRQVDPERRACAAAPVIATLTWEQLGVPPELAALVTPQLHLFAATGDDPFAEVASPVSSVGYPTDVVSTDDGFTLVAANPVDRSTGAPVVESAQVFTSPDGATWTKTADLPDIAGQVLGVVDGRAVFAGVRSNGASAVDILGPQGLVATVSPEDAVAEPGYSASYFGVSGFGPLGWATLLYNGDDGQKLVHSDRTGQRMSVVPVPAELLGWGYPVGMSVTADAIVVRFTQDTDGDPATPAAQRLLVGTPRG